MSDLYVRFTESIAKLNKLVHKIKLCEMNKYGLQAIHASCVYYLSKNKQGLTAKELCDMTLEDKAAISRALRSLAEKDFVEYAPRSRNKTVLLTKKGENLAQSICIKIGDAVAAGSADISNDQREMLYGFLLEITDNLSCYYQNLMKSEEKK